MHILIVGASYSGKSNLAKRLAAQAEKRGEKIIVHDPLKSSGWPKSAILYAKSDVFLDEVWKHENAHIFIDESRVLFDTDRMKAEKLAYLGRHGGRLCYFIGQRAMSMIPPNARNQCGKAFAFKQSANDSKILAEEYHDIFLKCPRLQKGEFVCSDGFTAFSGSLDYSQGLPPFINLNQEKNYE